MLLKMRKLYSFKCNIYWYYISQYMACDKMYMTYDHKICEKCSVECMFICRVLAIRSFIYLLDLLLQFNASIRIPTDILTQIQCASSSVCPQNDTIRIQAITYSNAKLFPVDETLYPFQVSSAVISSRIGECVNIQQWCLLCDAMNITPILILLLYINLAALYLA